MKYLDDEVREWLGEDFEESRGFVSGAELQRGHQRLRETLQEAAGSFHREKHQDGQPVETVVDRGSGKRPGMQQGDLCCSSKPLPQQHVVTWTHRSKSSLSPACIRATMVLVTDVPMLEPMMMGTADCTSSTAAARKVCQPLSFPRQRVPGDVL